MTDLEMTKLCAEAMGVSGKPVSDGVDECGLPMIWTTEGYERHKHAIVISRDKLYDPLHDDAQAMALVKKLWLDCKFMFSDEGARWWKVRGTVSGWEITENADLNRAIVECVAKMQRAKSV